MISGQLRSGQWHNRHLHHVAKYPHVEGAIPNTSAYGHFTYTGLCELEP